MSTPSHFPRKPFGYDRTAVDRILAERDRTEEALSTELAAMRARATSLEQELRSARQEVRYWTDRKAYVDNEAQRVRGVVEEILRDARSGAEAIQHAAREEAMQIVRAANENAGTIRVNAADQAQQIELEARERAMHVLERVCSQSDEIIDRANSAADRIRAQADSAHEDAQRRLNALRELSRQVEDRIRRTIKTFDLAVDELAAPVADSVSLPDTMAQAIRSGANDTVAEINRTDQRPPLVLRAVVSDPHATAH